jgi:hypothetical protein
MVATSNEVTGLQLSNNTYNNFKFVVQIVLPSLGVLYATLSEIWGFPRVQEVVGTISALALFLGVILRISSANYANRVDVAQTVGSFIIKPNDEGGKTILLELDETPEQLVIRDKDVLSFRVESVEQEDREQNVL